MTAPLSPLGSVGDPPLAAEASRTDSCPLGHRCESCGASGTALAVSVLPVLGETLCLTMCTRCRSSGMLPAIQVSTAAKLVTQHAGHVRPMPERRVVGRPYRLDQA